MSTSQTQNRIERLNLLKEDLLAPGSIQAKLKRITDSLVTSSTRTSPVSGCPNRQIVVTRVASTPASWKVHTSAFREIGACI